MIGDIDKVLKYDVTGDRWSTVDQRSSSQYRGDLKYSAVSRISPNSLLMTGGVSTRDLQATMRVYYINIDETSNKCDFTV